MNPNYKKVLSVNLATGEIVVKIHKDINNLIGGIACGLALCLQEKEKFPITINIGPLSGLFPFMSKTNATFINDLKEPNEAYGGGGFALALKMSGLDSICITEKSPHPVALEIENQTGRLVKIGSKLEYNNFKKGGFSGKKSLVEFLDNCQIDSYFSFGSPDLAILGKQKNLKAILISGTSSSRLSFKSHYERMFFDIIAKSAELDVPFMGFKSCGICPAGCRYSKNGEGVDNTPILGRCLVSCQYAKNIYKNIPRVFSCLESVGYHYNHDDLEGISEKVGLLKAQFK